MMTTTTTARPTLDTVLAQAQQLDPADQARLVSLLATDFAAKLTITDSEQKNPRATLEQIREEFRRQGPVSPSMTEDLAATRR